MRSDDSIDIRSAAIAVVVSLGLHGLLLWALPPTFHQAVAFVRPVEVLTAPVKVDEARLPPKLRFAEANPLANRAVPQAAPFTSSRNQTAAQPVPEKMPTASPLPKSAGTSEQIRLAQGKPRSIDQSQAAPAAGPSVSMAAPPTVPKPGPGQKVAPPPVPAAANPERPRASAPAGTAGRTSDGRAGAAAGADHGVGHANDSLSRWRTLSTAASTREACWMRCLTKSFSSLALLKATIGF